VFHRLFIANRGDVAVRVARACDALKIVPVFAVSEADRDAGYVRDREHIVLGPGRGVAPSCKTGTADPPPHAASNAAAIAAHAATITEFTFFT